MSKREKAIYPLEFKRSSAKLAVESTQAICQTAKDLGVEKTTLYTWVAKFYPKRRSLSVSNDPTQEENQRLKRENARLKQERDILKKAAAYFAKDI